MLLSVERSTTANRGSVLDAACVLFAERGYHGTSMKDIAEKLGVRAPSLYNHVTSKQDMLYAIMDKAMDRALTALDETLAGVGDVSERLRRATESLVLDFLRYPAEVTVCNNEVRSLEAGNRLAIVAKRDRYAARVRGIIEDGVAAGQFAIESPSLGSFAIREMCVSISRWFRADGPISPEQVAREYSEFAVRIVGTV